MSQDRNDKNNPSYSFTPPVNYSPEVVQAASEVVRIVDNSNLSEAEKKDAVWVILNKQ